MTERRRAEDICPESETVELGSTRPMAPGIFPASVWACGSTDEAEQLLTGELDGFVYQRDGHPNAVMLADKCRRLHRAPWAMITSSGMAALAAVVLGQLRAGDHLVVSNQLYGRSLVLLDEEATRLGLSTTRVDTCNLTATAEAISERTRLVVVETIANPLLRVADLQALARLAHQANAQLLVDNTFATPLLCRPLEWGADWVIESISKMINGHSDVMLGLVCGPELQRQRTASVVSTWGLASGPFDCYLAARGLATLALRMRQATENAWQAAEWLGGQPRVERVDYPGRNDHPDRELARRQFDTDGDRFGSVVTFHLTGGREAADRFIAACDEIPFSPSLGEVSTTLSHPESTSHRGLTPEQRATIGISGGTVRLSLGCESTAHVLAALEHGLAAIG